MQDCCKVEVVLSADRGRWLDSQIGLSKYIKLVRRKQASSILVLNFVQDNDSVLAERIRSMQGAGSTLHLHHAKSDGSEISPSPSLASNNLASPPKCSVEAEGSSEVQERVELGREADMSRVRVVSHEDLSATSLHDLDLMSAGEVRDAQERASTCGAMACCAAANS